MTDEAEKWFPVDVGARPPAPCPFCGSADTYISPGFAFRFLGVNKSYFIVCFMLLRRVATPRILYG